MADENLIKKECQCCCNEVTLMTENEPEVVNFGDPCHEEVDFVSPGEPIVIMFDEETEMYYSDIVHTREVVDEMRDTLDDHTTKLNNIQSTANTNQTKINAVKTVVDGIASDMSSVAKQGSDSTATNTKILETEQQVMRAFIEKTHTDIGDTTPNRFYINNNAFDLVGYTTINNTSYSVWVCSHYAGLWYLYVSGTPAVGVATYQMVSGSLSQYDNITAVETYVIASEANATANKEAIIEAVNNAQPDLSSVAKQGTNADATNTDILEAIQQGGGGLKPSVLLDSATNTLTFRLFTLQQMEDVKIFFSGVSSPAKFVVTTDEDDFFLNFSNDSPEGLAGEYVLDDAVEMYTDKWLLNIVVEIPSTFTIASVYIEGADCNLLEDTQWRDADIQRDVKNMDAKLGDYVLIQDDEYAPALADLATNFN